MDQFGLVEPVDRLGQGVVVADGDRQVVASSTPQWTTSYGSSRPGGAPLSPQRLKRTPAACSAAAFSRGRPEPKSRVSNYCPESDNRAALDSPLPAHAKRKKSPCLNPRLPSESWRPFLNAPEETNSLSQLSHLALSIKVGNPQVAAALQCPL